MSIFGSEIGSGFGQPGGTPGGALGYFLGGYVPPGTPNWDPVLKKIPLEMGHFLILRSRVQQEYNNLLVNALNRIFKSNLSLNNFKWLLTKLELSRVRNIIPRSRKRL